VQAKIPAHFVTISTRQELTNFFFGLRTLWTSGELTAFLTDK
jgi:hypothetical protein